MKGGKMKKPKLVFRFALTAIILLSLCVICNAYSIQWEKNLGGSLNDWGRDIKRTPDGGYVIVGWTESNDFDVSENHGQKDVWVVKLREDGSIEKQISLGGSGDDEGYGIELAPGGGYILIGSTDSCDCSPQVSGNHGGKDVWVVKLTPSLDLEWAESYGGREDDVGYEIIPTSDNGYAFIGKSKSTDFDVSSNNGDFDIWVVKLRSDRTIEWQKSIGLTGNDEGYVIRQTSEGEYMVMGRSDVSYSNLCGWGSYDSGNDLWIGRIRPDGSVASQYCVTDYNDDEGYSMQPTSDGKNIIAGKTNSNCNPPNHGGYDAYIVKASSGSEEFRTCRGGSNDDEANDIRESSYDVVLWRTNPFRSETVTYNTYVLTGMTNSNDGDVTSNHGLGDVWFVVLDRDSRTITDQKTFGGRQEDIGMKILDIGNNNLILLGNTRSNDGDVSVNHGANDIWVIKLYHGRYNYLIRHLFLPTSSP
jgi:hypothetical protein